MPVCESYALTIHIALCAMCAPGKSHPTFLLKPAVSSTELSKSLPNKALLFNQVRVS